MAVPDDSLEIELEDEPETPSAAPLVINLEDLPPEEEGATARAYPGLTGPVPGALQVSARCSARGVDFVLALSPRSDGGYLIQPGLESDLPAAPGGVVTVPGPFFIEKGCGCPQCGAQAFLVCPCGAISCHAGGRFARCPSCRRRVVVTGAPGRLTARGLGKGG
jgi:hypothetical protein